MKPWMILLLYIAGVFLLLYILSIRPARKKHKIMVDLQNKIQPGDEIITIGGIIGKVVDKEGDTFTIMTDEKNKTTVKIIKYAVQSVIEKEK